ncbi:unnamed protein product [Adineta steineri]|uniref:Uncharacterized protein n=2 Tax=Adineta steineri TaxID=433720 RepID=A0A815GDK4_9BILA|nr:unnamed protein product [Adineta steineri]CAF1337173.1 unnamed protein product [Adineta steineri]CAF3775672.1 unnamed protein product [Adineta steineri]CAF3951487.1 unnamed protein product [Adineta steineri]
MSTITDISNTNFTDITGRATERLIQNIPTLINQRKSPMTLQRQEIKERLDAGSHQKTIIDLDEIIEKWIWKMWELSKRNREDSKYRREELDVKINWKRANFWQSEAVFAHPNQKHLPKSQILFKTHFSNNTDCEQEYSLRAERSTVTTLSFTFTRGFTKEKEGSVKFKLPNEVLEVGGGLRHEQRVDYGKDSTFETLMLWSANSAIRVSPHSKANAELCITEEEYAADFSIEVRFSGRISAMISTRNNTGGYYKYMEGDLATIFSDALRSGNSGISSGQFEVHEQTQTVRTVMLGKCAFRYGIEQYVNVEQEKLTDLSSSITNEPPPKYRPVFSSHNIH